MSKSVEIKVERDHLISLTKATGVTAIAELIWNSLDADAKKVEVRFVGSEMNCEEVQVIDDGKGIDYDSAVKAFQSLGGSNKKDKRHSEEFRALHGKEGKGRLKAFAIGDTLTFESIYYDAFHNRFNSFEIKLDKIQIQKAIVSDVNEGVDKSHSGFRVVINNIEQDNANQIIAEKGIADLEDKFAVYSMNYPNFEIDVNGNKLNFKKLIADIKNIDLIHYIGDQENLKEVKVQIKIIEWKKERDKKLYLCNSTGIVYADELLGLRTSGYNISVHLLSEYFENLHKTSQLDLRESIEDCQNIIEKAKNEVRKYIRGRRHAEAANYIDELKKENIYPYKDEPKDEIEKVNRQVFDIVALQINDHLEDFKDQTQKSKRFTLTLIKEALEKDSSSLPKILEEVIQLPKDKQDDLKDLLEKTSLSVIIDVIKTITDRLKLIQELRLILFDKEKNIFVKERKHLHRIVKDETWIFGDDYTYGADDVNLRTVLKAYLSFLGRDEFEEIADSSLLRPDICLWKQFNSGKVGHFHNLVIELKRPSKVVGATELAQIKSYAMNIIQDDRFPKDKTEWTFILLVTGMNEFAEAECLQSDRKYGHIWAKEGVNVYVKKWGDLLCEAEARHQFLKEKLNYNISEDKEGIDLLKKKYAKYLPDEIMIPENKEEMIFESVTQNEG